MPALEEPGSFVPRIIRYDFISFKGINSTYYNVFQGALIW